MLVPNFSGVINKTGDTITVTDITGADNLPLSTKYATGSSNPNHPKSDNLITEFVVTKPDGSQVTKQYNSLIANVSPNITATVPLPIPASALTLNWSTANLNSSDLLFPDGMIRVDVTVWMYIDDGGDDFLLASDLKTINNLNATFISSKTGVGDTIYIKVIKAGNSNIIVNNTILSVVSNTQLILNNVLPNTFVNDDPLQIYAGYKTTFWIKCNVNLLKCFLPKVAKLSITEVKCCETCGQSKIDELTDMYLAMFDIEAQISVGMNDEAQKNILALGKICNNLDCNTC